MAGDDIAAARAAADQQMALVDSRVTKQVVRARAMLPAAARTDVWSVLVTNFAAAFDCRSKRQHFAAEMLASAVLRLAETPESASTDEKEVPEA